MNNGSNSLVAIGDSTIRVSDGNYSSKYPKSHEFLEAGVPFISANNLRNGRVVKSNMKFISKEQHKTLKKGHLRAGDVLLVTRGSLGTTAFVTKEFEDANINAQLVLLRADNETVDARYLFQVVNSLEFQAQVASNATGTAQPQLPIGPLTRLTIPLPEINVQRKIAGILSAYDDLIENNLRRIKILEQMAQSLYREWFVHFRFPGHETVKMVDSPLGKIPEGWEVRMIEELVKRIPVGKKYDQKSASPTGLVPIFDQGKTGIIGYHDDEPGVVATDDAPIIVFANHTCYQRLVHYPFSAIQNVLPFLPNPEIERNIYWLHHATNGKLVLNDYKGHWPEFAALVLSVPTAGLSGLFGDFVKPISLQILRLERANQTLRRTRDLLLPKLLSVT